MPSGADVAESLCQEILNDAFFQEFWERKPLHHRAAERGPGANKLPEALLPDEVAGAVGSAVGSNLKMFKNNESSELPSPWHSYLAGYSMVINQADRHSKVLYDLCKGLSARHFHHVFAVVYLTPPNSQAVRVHTDDQDVILLQVWGSKRWTLYNAPTKLPYTEEMLGKEQAVPETLIGPPELDFTMQPHDVLYIPRGVLHEAATGSEPSLHITITVPTSDFCWGVQLVKHLATDIRQGEYPKELRSLCQASLVEGMSADLDDATLDKKLKEILQTWISGVSAQSVLDSFESRMDRTNQGQDRQFSQFNAEDTLQNALATQDKRARLMHSISCCCEEGSDAAVFLRPDGRALKMKVTAAAAKLIRALSDKPQRIRDLPCGDAFERICILEVLRHNGVLQLFLKGPEACAPEPA